MKTFSEWNENAAYDPEHSKIILPKNINEMIEVISNFTNEIKNIDEKFNAFETNFGASGIAGAFPEYRDDASLARKHFEQAITGCYQVSKSLNDSMAILSSIAKDKINGEEEALGDILIAPKFRS